MPILHIGKTSHIQTYKKRSVWFLNYIVIFKLKPGVTDAQLAEMRTAGEAMVGQIPGTYD
jgi:hypothetical protein